jgi:DNA-binding MarR family transcriptional regulator/ribosomal protein S18 acetylase RimI-like enzyme
MDDVAQVRRFNRTVTERVGALDDHYLSRGRPLGEARVLWEVGEGDDGCDVRALRERLGLDSGYLSRLLRSLEHDGLVTTAPAEGDRRVRVARLTDAGRAERAVLDRGSDELAEAMLAPLSRRRRARLVAAMGEVERLLTAAMVRIGPLDPSHPHGRYCLGEYAAELDRRFDGGFDPGRGTPVDDAAMRPPGGLLVVARLRSEPVGCGVLCHHDGAWTEIKRVWIAPSVRGLGVGRRLLGDLEARAAAHGPIVRLDTNAALQEAIAMYRAAGYAEIARFNDNPYAHHWFEKRVGTS